MNLYRSNAVADDWPSIRAELERLFVMSRAAAQAEESFVYVVNTDDLLGRGGLGNAMVATGLLSAARTAALEGSRKGWTVNVIGVEDDADPALVEVWAQSLLDQTAITGELMRFGPGHLGKALP